MAETQAVPTLEPREGELFWTGEAERWDYRRQRLALSKHFKK
jgi:hypothetical protein